MRSKKEILWEAVETKRYSEIPEIINNNPDEDLVNSTNPNQKSGRTLAMQVAFVKPMQTPEILKCVLLHPKVNLQYKNPITKSTVVSALIDSTRPELIKLFENEKEPKIIFDIDNCFSYFTAIGIKKKNEEALEQEKADPDGDEDSKRHFELRIQNLEKIISMLRDITILHAIRNDDADLMKKFHNDISDFKKKFKIDCPDINDNLGELGGKQLPTRLLKPDGNIRKFFRKLQDQLQKEISESTSTISENYKKIKGLEEQEKQLLKDKAQAQFDVLKEHNKNIDKRLDQLSSILGQGPK